MSQQTISVTFVAAGTFTWQNTDNGGIVASGTGTSFVNAGTNALSTMKTYLGSQATNFTNSQNGWQ